MGFVNRFAAACLRAAARRWPADVRDDLAREWAAELSMLEQQAGTGWRRLAFAISLAITPLTVDESGAPRSRWEWMRAGATLRTVSRLAFAGAFGFGIALVVRSLANGLLLNNVDDDTRWLVSEAVVSGVTAALMTVYTVVVGRWAGSRGAPEPGPAGSLGVAATAVLPLAVLLPYFLTVQTDMVFGLSLVVAACWTVGAGVLVATGVRGSTRAWAGVPLVAVLPTLALLLRGLPDPRVYLVSAMADLAFFLLPWTVCVVVFGRATVRRWATPTVYDVPDPEPEAVSAASAGPLRWWRPTLERAVLVPVAAASAVMWALGVTVLQPLSEPTGPDAYAENNTYWARELRWDALFAVLLVVLVLARGDRRATRGVLLGGAAWLAVDVLLDRVDPAASATVPLAIGAVVAAIIGCAATGALPVVPRNQVLLTVATVAAVMSSLATETESPTDVERALNLGSAAAGSLLAVVAVAAAVRAAGEFSRLRAVVAVPVGAVAAAGPWLLRLRYPQPTDGRFHGILVFVGLLLLAVVVLAGPRPRAWRDWLRYPAALAVVTVALPVMMMPLIFMFIALPAGDLFTALAGNTAIDSADEDIITVFVALPVGLALGRLLRGLVLGGPMRFPLPRPRPTAPPAAQPDLVTP